MQGIQPLSKYCIEWALFLPPKEKDSAWDERVEDGYMIFVIEGLEAFMKFQRRELQNKKIELLIIK